jgi:hypothetical protein
MGAGIGASTMSRGAVTSTRSGGGVGASAAVTSRGCTTSVVAASGAVEVMALSHAAVPRSAKRLAEKIQWRIKGKATAVVLALAERTVRAGVH